MTGEILGLTRVSEMPSCNNCDSFKTKQYVRVFGDDDNELHRCHDCSIYGEMLHGVGAGRSPDTIEP